MSIKDSRNPRQPLRKSWYHYLDPLLRGPTPPVPEQREVCPETATGLLGRLSFSWMTDIMVVGRRRAIEMGDIWLISPERRIERLTDRFHAARRARDERGATAHRLLLAMHDVFRAEFWTGAFWLFTTVLCQAFIPFTLRYLLNYLTAAYEYSHGEAGSQTGTSIAHGFAFVIAMLVMQLLRAVSTNQYIYYGMRNGAQARALLISVIFGKSLDLSVQARAGSPGEGAEKTEGGHGAGDSYSSSRLLTLMSSDAARIDMAAGSFHSIWAAPFQMLLTFALLLVNLGYSVVTGFALLLLGVATLTYALKLLVRRRRAINTVTDDRNARMLEVLEAISAIKYGGMERPLLSRISALRSAEVDLVTRLNVIRNALNAFSISLPLFAAGISFASYANTGHTLSAAPIFSSLALFMSLRQPFNILPRAIGQGADAWSSFQRLELLFHAAPRSAGASNSASTSGVPSVDAHVGARIFEYAICGHLRDRTRILSTHQLHILSRCDRVLWLDGGRIKALETFADLHAHHAGFRALVASHRQRTSPETDERPAEGQQIHNVTTEANPAVDKGTLSRKEDMKQGDMSWGLLASYLRGSGSALFGLIPLVFLVLAQGSNTLTSVWLSMWTSYKFDMSTNMYIGVLLLIATAQTLFLLLFGATVSVLCGRASRRLVNAAINQVVNATMAFHDATPLGRVVNRLSRDVELVDNQLPESVRMFVYTVAIVASVVVLISAYVPWFVLAISPLGAVIIYAATYYLASETQFKRFEATLRGVVYARASEAVAGFDAIRMYGARGATTQSLYGALDDMTSACLLTLGNQRWIATRLDLVAIAIIIGVSLLAVFLRNSLDPSVSGLLLSYSLAFTQMMQLVIRQLSEVENSMVSVERLTEYATTLPQEAPPPPEGSVHIPPAWPDKGHVTLDGVQARYRPGLPNALDGIDLTIEGGQKVAIVGRTGAGKSSIAASLFRLVELSGGSIKIDGLNISRIPLSELRSRLSIIPQEPRMFRGTLRANLDPFDESTDAVLWDVVRRVQLRGEVADAKGGNYLDMAVEEHGSNFSKGQRQLISVARALLRQSSIVVCDEATSSIDLNTDKRIQDIMMEAFASRTVITIAHRLQTIVGYDVVCIMDHGRIVEQGPPHELWQKQESSFRSLCDKDGIENHNFSKNPKY